MEQAVVNLVVFQLGVLQPWQVPAFLVHFSQTHASRSPRRAQP